MKGFGVLNVVFKCLCSNRSIFWICIVRIEEYIFIENEVNATEANEVCLSLGIGSVGITIPDRNTYNRVIGFLENITINFEGVWLNHERNPGEREVTDYVSREGIVFEEGFADIFGENPWGNTQPSFIDNLGEDNEFCVEMRNVDFVWNDKECGRAASTLCSRSCSPTVSPTVQPTLIPSEKPTTSPTSSPTLSP